MLLSIEKNIQEIINILSEDEKLIFLLTNNKILSSADIKKNELIVSYPVMLDSESKLAFVSVIMDNAPIINNTTYIVNFKISCGVSKDFWLTEDKKIRIYEIANRIETLLSNIRVSNSTGILQLKNVSSVYWNSITTGISLVFQLTEGETNAKQII